MVGRSHQPPELERSVQIWNQLRHLFVNTLKENTMSDLNVVDDSQVADSLKQMRGAQDRILEQLGKLIVGQEEVVNQLLICLFVGGHSLITGLPGLAKTLLVRSLSRTLGLSFNRIQFTPDLMPADITGTEIIEEDRSTGRRQLRFVKGPVFANLILADEINRTPPKTQAALLEAMQERHVYGGRSDSYPFTSVLCLCYPEPDRTGRNLSPAGGSTGSIHVQHCDRLS